MTAVENSGLSGGGAPRRTCFLHIGPHKTGTTSIQDALFDNAERLAAIGVFYPTVSGDRGGRQRRNHTPLARASNFKADDLMASPFWEELSLKIADIDGSIVISTEHFAERLREAENFERVVAFFERHGFRVTAVAYVRDQPGWLNSWYTQDQRNFISRDSFSEFLARALEFGLVDPWGYLGRFIDDPRTDVRVVSFERAIKTGLARSFLDAIGAPEDFEIAEPNPSNPNLGVKGMYAAQEIMRRVNGRVRSLPNYNQLYERFKKLMRGRDWEKTAYIGFTPEEEKRIRDRYAASNDAFAQRFFGVDWATICPPRSASLREFDFASAPDEDKRDVLEVIDQMVDAIEASRADADIVLPPLKGKKGKGKKGKGQGRGQGEAARMAEADASKAGA
ncbi:hypothetical protein IHQ68_18330 [Chelatococcus sambhunathii]|uniref:Sulfotransferase family protein n=1 Tax=Chelatococcus sambhunathii TaxID=363953 RepID=A0ABU1DKC4_9HYPH|nr:hypothetical protein [Chelatococcus sambhunathii]MDR4308582.1 hypothetical protein [Chelatococcus sambhunathii]